MERGNHSSLRPQSRAKRAPQSACSTHAREREWRFVAPPPFTLSYRHQKRIFVSCIATNTIHTTLNLNVIKIKHLHPILRLFFRDCSKHKLSGIGRSKHFRGTSRINRLDNFKNRSFTSHLTIMQGQRFRGQQTVAPTLDKLILASSHSLGRRHTHGRCQRCKRHLWSRTRMHSTRW
jgi:hypothetical protein